MGYVIDWVNTLLKCSGISGSSNSPLPNSGVTAPWSSLRMGSHMNFCRKSIRNNSLSKITDCCVQAIKKLQKRAGEQESIIEELFKHVDEQVKKCARGET